MFWSILLGVIVSIDIQHVAGNHMYREAPTFSNLSDISLNRSKRSEEHINFSFPGTKWCGPGSTARNYDDLGYYKDLDKCCRIHDHCDSIPAGGLKNNLMNDDHFTRLHCDCDKEFYQCLQAVNTKTANNVGQLYFSLRNKCYQAEHPIVECVGYDSKKSYRRCVRYLLDESQPKYYQWFDLPFYI